MAQPLEQRVAKLEQDISKLTDDVNRLTKDALFLEQRVNKLEKEKILGGVYLSAELQAGTPHRFVHGLGRAWKGWSLTRLDSGTTLFETNITETNRSKEVWLQASSDANVTIYLF